MKVINFVLSLFTFNCLNNFCVCFINKIMAPNFEMYITDNIKLNNKKKDFSYEILLHY